MPIEILMPALSPTMTEGTISKWVKKEGDSIKAGTVIAEIETDKATMEIESIDDGILAKILIPEGTENVPVNQLIAVLLEEGEDASAIAKVGGGSPASAPAAAKADDKPAKVEEKTAPVAASPAASGDRVFATPLARRVASNEGVDLSSVQGSGPNGRIVKDDVLSAKSASPQSSSSASVSAVSFGRVSPEVQEVKLSGMRKTIAKRLQESKQNIPHFYLSIDVNIDDLLAGRVQLNDMAAARNKEKPAYKISVNDFVIKASALALRDVPAANASWNENNVLQYTNVDISVAVAIEGGLITPVVKNADQKSLAAISNEMKDLAKRARDGKLKPEEYQGGGFSISNLGMFGIKQFNAIINPPQSCIIAVGAAQTVPVLKGGVFVPSQVMNITLSCDHRVVDGAVGAELLTALKGYLENPLSMVV